jgi:hypothetical protein
MLIFAAVRARHLATLFAVLSCTLLASCGGDGSNALGDAGGVPNFETPQDVLNYLEGKTLTMTGAAIPSHPQGFDEDKNLGSATQCYQRVTINPSGGGWHMVQVFGTLTGAPTVGDTGTCDHATSSGQLTFDSTQIVFENVMDDCIDITATYTGFTLEGRAKIDADAHTLSLELYFAGQATGHRCVNGAVGSATVQVQGAAFTGNAVQVYTIE